MDLRFIQAGIGTASGVGIGTGIGFRCEVKRLGRITIRADRASAPTESPLRQATELTEIPKMCLKACENDTEFQLVRILCVHPHIPSNNRIDPTPTRKRETSWRKNMGTKRPNLRQSISTGMHQSAGNMERTRCQSNETKLMVATIDKR